MFKTTWISGRGCICNSMSKFTNDKLLVSLFLNCFRTSELKITISLWFFYTFIDGIIQTISGFDASETEFDISHH